MTEYRRNQAAAVNGRGVAAVLAKLPDEELAQRLAMLLPDERRLVVEALRKHQGIEVDA